MNKFLVVFKNKFVFFLDAPTCWGKSARTSSGVQIRENVTLILKITLSSKF